MTIEDALCEKLKGEATVTAVVGSRIHLGRRDPNEDGPSIVVRFVSSRPEDGAGCDNDTWQYEMEIHLWAASDRAARALADVVAPVLRGWKCTDPESGPWSLDREYNDADNPDNGESFAGGKIVQEYSAGVEKT